MKLDKQQIQHLGLLARIGLTDDDIEKYQNQLSSILDYADQLNEINTDNIEPVSQITGQKNVLRDDQVIEDDDFVSLVKIAPETENDMIKTKSVFDKKQAE